MKPHSPPGRIRRLASRALALPALALLAWGCQDTTGTSVSPEDGASPRLGQVSAYYCSTLVANPQGPQAGEIPLHFPAEARSANGSTMEYRYRRQAPSGALAYSADCMIPRTLRAVELMNQRFSVPPELRAPKGRDRNGNEFTTQGCVKAGECVLEPIIVAPPVCDEKWDPSCGSSGGGGTTPPPPTYPPPGGGGGGDGGEGAYVPPAAPGDDIPSNPAVPDCTNAVDTKEIAWCNGWVPEGEFRKRVDDALARMAQRGIECSKLAEKARTLLGTRSFRFTDVDYAGWGAAAPFGGDWVIFERSWIDSNWSERNLDYVISHEMDHSAGNAVPGLTDSQGHLLKADGTVDSYHTANSRQCAGLV